MTSHSNIPERDLELLSAYLDGEMSDAERHALEQRLATESDLRRALDELRATVGLVSSLPQLKAPRSFALDPAEYGRRAPWWQRLLSAGAVMQLSGALGTAASIILIVLGLVLGGEESAPLQTQEAQAPAYTSSAAPAAASLPTTVPDTPTLAPSPPPLMDSEFDDAGADIPGENAAAAARGIGQAPMDAPPFPDADSAASTFAGTFAETEGFAPPEAASPLPHELEVPQMERFAESEIAADTADEAAAPPPEEEAFPLQALPATASPPPTATAGETSASADGADTEPSPSAPTLAAKRADSQPDDAGPRWWLVALGAAGLALSSVLILLGRRQAGV